MYVSLTKLLMAINSQSINPNKTIENQRTKKLFFVLEIWHQIFIAVLSK